MSSIEQEKLSTEKFLENAIGESQINDEKTKNENEKLIMEETSKEKSPKFDSEIKEENVSEETESTRDLNSTEREVDKDENDLDVSIDEEKPKEEWQDILGSGVIMKKILKEGEPDTKPNRSDKCIINYSYRLEEADEDSSIEKVDNFELAVGEGDVVQGLDVAITLMNKNERCLLKIGSRLAFGQRGLAPHIPGNATVMFDIELLDTQPETNIENMSVPERQRMGNNKRERGNWWYQRGENTLAVQCYRRALDYLDEVETENTEHEKPSDSELQQLLEDRLKVLNNMASAQIKMELYDQALTSLQTVLRCQPDNVKALFRKAKIYSVKHDLPQALKLLEKAKALEPEDTLITKEISVVTGLINKQKNSEREYARRMFGTSSPSSSSSSSVVKDKRKKSKGGGTVWATLAATVAIGLAGMIVYKLKYP